MTDLLHILPTFPVAGYTHLIPSLERHLITCTDLLTLDPPEIAKRALLPVHDVRKLAAEILVQLQGQVGLSTQSHTRDRGHGKEGSNGDRTEETSLSKTGIDLVQQWSVISTLDPNIDAALGGGIPTRYITEITGESGAGKTQLLLTLLLSAQLRPPHGLFRSTLYISTEHPLPTTRLNQLLTYHPILSSSKPQPSLSKILTLQVPDLESQDHILTYQLPVILARHCPALVVIDSIAANYRAEISSLTTIPSNQPAALAQRSTDLVRLGNLLGTLAREHDCAIVVANQVGDRFPSNFSPQAQQTHKLRVDALSSSPSTLSSFGSGPRSSPPVPPTTHIDSISQASTARPPEITATPAHLLLTLDHQQRFFTGWGDSRATSDLQQNLKTPSLGLVWSNQIACRIALWREASYELSTGETVADGRLEDGSADWRPVRWKRWIRLVFAPWIEGARPGMKGVEFQLWKGGVRSTGEA